MGFLRRIMKTLGASSPFDAFSWHARRSRRLASVVALGSGDKKERYQQTEMSLKQILRLNVQSNKN